MGRARLPLKKKKAIRKRLKQLLKKDRLNCTEYELGRWFGRSDNAIDRWFYHDAKKSSIPEIDVLLGLSRDHNVNLHWLLFNEGQWYREAPIPSEMAAPKTARPSTRIS